MNDVIQEFPDFDLEEFYLLAKRINDFINDPNFATWSEIILESVQCKKQVNPTVSDLCRLGNQLTVSFRLTKRLTALPLLEV